MSKLVAIGVDVGGTGTKAGVVDTRGEVLLRAERPTDRSAGTKGIIAAVEDLMVRVAELGVDPCAVGIGVAGFVDHASGTVTFSPNLVYDDPEIGAALRARVQVPVTVDNDANAAALGETTFGTARGSRHVAMVTLGTGIGSGFVVDGALVRGWTGAGAEFGHTVIDPSGPPCTCGLRGCLEQFASGTAIARLAQEALEQDPASSILSFAGSAHEVTAEHVARAAREYDDTARAVLRRAGRALGIGLSNIVNVFDPEVIVLAGSVVAAGESYLGPARDQLARMTTDQRRRAQRVDVSALEADVGIVGAAALGFQEAGVALS